MLEETAIFLYTPMCILDSLPPRARARLSGPWRRPRSGV